MASPKTTAVVFKNGTVGRGVKLSEKNKASVKEWLGKSYEISINGKMRIFNNGSRAIRIAKVGDTIVKTVAGFTVIKAADFEKYISI